MDAGKCIDKRIELDLASIKERVLINLIPTLFFYKKKGVEITINFIDETKVDAEYETIKPTDVPNFLTKEFVVTDREGSKHKFILNYLIEHFSGSLYAFYCANNRTVCEFADKDFRLSLPYGYSGFLLLESQYLDSRVNNERGDFSIFPIRTDAFSTLSWEAINEKLKLIITEIVKEGIPNTEKINKEKINYYSPI